MDDPTWKLFQKSVKNVGECELWTGPGFGEKGFGLFKSGEIKLLAHRAAFMHYEGGYIPENNVLQSCKNKRCCAQAHLSENPVKPRF